MTLQNAQYYKHEVHCGKAVLSGHAGNFCDLRLPLDLACA